MTNQDLSIEAKQPTGNLDIWDTALSSYVEYTNPIELLAQ
jgi:hypothetical protein